MVCRLNAFVFKDFRATGHSTFLALSVITLIVSYTEGAGIPIQSLLISKRVADPSTTDDFRAEESFSDLQGVRYDEYPVVVPKRAALIIDRILKEIEAARDNTRVDDWGSPITRRGNKEKIYFRCYFNAVSCYRRK